MRCSNTDSLQDIAEHAESMSAAELELKKQSRRYFVFSSLPSVDTCVFM